jgi:hypothetical protein
MRGGGGGERSGGGGGNMGTARGRGHGSFHVRQGLGKGLTGGGPTCTSQRRAVSALACAPCPCLLHHSLQTPSLVEPPLSSPCPVAQLHTQSYAMSAIACAFFFGSPSTAYVLSWFASLAPQQALLIPPRQAPK